MLTVPAFVAFAELSMMFLWNKFQSSSFPQILHLNHHAGHRHGISGVVNFRSQNSVLLLRLMPQLTCLEETWCFRLVPSSLTNTRPSGSSNFFLTLTPSTMYVQCYERLITPVLSPRTDAFHTLPYLTSPWQDHGWWEDLFYLSLNGVKAKQRHTYCQSG
jgi:hypothetical protein